MYQKNNSNRRSQTASVSQAINDLLTQYHLKPRFDELQLVATWPELMGKTIAGKTGKIYVKNDILMVEVNSGPLKHELNMSKDKVMNIIEDKFGKGVISNIMFI